MQHYNSYRNYLRQRFGTPVLKVSLNGGFSCPNRDGTKSVNGCAFCDNRSFSHVVDSITSPHEELARVIYQHSGKCKAFLPYLQPFSNTYGPVEQLRAIYEPLLTVPGIIGLAVGTRPDCFTNETYTYFEELAKKTYVSVELGIQSIHDTTLLTNNRGHTFQDFQNTVERLCSIGVEVVAHVILGLRGDTPEMILQTASTLARMPVSGVKIHQLMIIGGTKYETWYKEGLVQPFTLEQYTELLCGFIERLRPDQTVHRIMADSRPEYGLIAPLWCTNKAEAIQFIHSYMDEVGLEQGRKFVPTPLIVNKAKGLFCI